MSTSGSWFAALWQDIRFAARLMRRNAGFSAAAILTLALGIGANSAVYSLVDAVVLHPLGYPEADRMQLLWTVEGRSQRAMNSSYLDFADWQRESRSFERMAAFQRKGFNLAGGGEAVRIQAIVASPGLLETYGVRPSLGRTIAAGDDPHVAVISHGLWVRRFAAAPDVLGKTVRLDGDQFAVIGVLPRNFHFQPRRDADPDVCVPMQPDPDRGRFDLGVVARLRAGVPRERAQAEMDAIAARIAQRNPEVDRRQGVLVSPLRSTVVQGTEKTAAVLLGAVAFLLLIACTNVANLSIARGVGREREIAVRLALGASRSRLIRQVLTESVTLALIAGAVGLVLAYLAVPLLAAIAPAHTPFLSRIEDNGIRVNSSVLLFTGAVSLLAAVLFGLFPALRATRPAGSSIHTGWASSTVAGGSRVAGVLIATEVALSFILLVGAGLMLSTLARLLAVDTGFRAEKLLTMSVMLPEGKYPDAAAQADYVARALERLGALPELRAVAAVSMLPITRSKWQTPFETDGNPPRSGQASFHAVSPAYFDAMGIPLLRGRAFAQTDRAGAPRVAIVSRALEKRYWPGGTAVGKLLTAPGTGERFDIVGVAGDVRQLGLDDDPRAEWYVPCAQAGTGNMFNDLSFVVRSAAASSETLKRRARAALQAVDADQPVTDVKTMEELMAADTASPRFLVVLIGLFALIAVGLAAIGIYGVVSHAVARRTGEVAVRLALGARPAEVVRLLARQQLVWAIGGVAVGMGGASALTRLLAAQLFEVKPTDLPTYAAAALLLATIAVVADLVPAWRATRVAPAAVLRNE